MNRKQITFQELQEAQKQLDQATRQFLSDPTDFDAKTDVQNFLAIVNDLTGDLVELTLEPSPEALLPKAKARKESA